MDDEDGRRTGIGGKYTQAEIDRYAEIYGISPRTLADWVGKARAEAHAWSPDEAGTHPPWRKARTKIEAVIPGGYADMASVMRQEGLKNCTHIAVWLRAHGVQISAQAIRKANKRWKFAPQY